MNEQDDRAGRDTGSDQGERDQGVSANRLVARLAELRGQLEVLAPQDQDRGREAIERIREAQERIATLDAMLLTAREREHDLTVQVVRDRAQITEYEARISELSTIAARVARAEHARRETEAVAEEREKALSIAHADVGALRAEAEKLRSRCAELEADLSVVSDEMAAAAIARTEAARLERERNEARERAHTERRLAAADRIRAAEAELRATELQSQLRAAERRIVQVAIGAKDQQEKASAEAEEERATSEPPWIELQRNSSGSAQPAAVEAGEPPDSTTETTAEPEPATSPADEPEVIDLTSEDEETSSTDDGGEQPNRIGHQKDEAWASTAGETLLGRLIHQRRRHEQ